MIQRWFSGFAGLLLLLAAQVLPADAQNPPGALAPKSVPVPVPSPSSARSTPAGNASVTTAPNAPPYEEHLLELAQTLGSLHYLSGLCETKNTTWRDQMNALLASEKPDDARQKRLISAFNNSYRSYAENYAQCTPQALKAIERFKQQGESLTAALLARYGN